MQTAKISTSEAGGQITIKVEGNLIFDLNREFRESYKGIPAKTPVIVDLANASYIDSAGIGMLIQLREHLGGNKGSVTVSGANETVKTILNVANLGRLFKIS